MNFTATKTPIEGLLVIEPRRFGDERGFFMETYRRNQFAELGIDCDFVQDNHSRSARGTLRGLHFQKRHPQAKLVRVLRGRVFDVAVDLRRGSASFGSWYGLVLDDRRHRQLFIPVGFAHGFLALSDGAEVAYKCSTYYRPDDEGGLRWDDPRLAIDWPLAEAGGEPILSDKDRSWPLLEQLQLEH
ncbi:MAG: dTDP-4-dehydrorhamnose 3,5-epimerase [Deltaproteobacteria bacterium]|nr:MAG: dTDP-4-dehydrorhamnose 3,5-epimerase [Deltaproteobacteria bacterium]